MPETAPSPTTEQLKKIFQSTLAPLLSGSEVGDRISARLDSAEHAVREDAEDASDLLLRPNPTEDDCFPLNRPQGFSDQEVQLADVGVSIISEALPHYGTRFFDDLLQASIRRIIVKFLGYTNEKLLLEILDSFESLSAQTYEGNRIAAAIGLDIVPFDDGVALGEIWDQDFIKVLTSGIDTMLTVSPEGRVYAYREFDIGDKLPFAPYHARLMADYATGNRISIVLNRNGEILIFRDKQLTFARRRGRWHYFVHEPIISLMGDIGDEELRRCVYETCLDVSFARCGGCIAVVRPEKRRSVRRLINREDRLHTGSSPKSQVIARLIQKQTRHRPFQELHRRFRQAIAAIDGATVLGHDGEILAVGAIVRVPGGSESGARRAAAKALAALGIGIKVSADGGIAGFVQDDGESSPRLVFEFT